MQGWGNQAQEGEGQQRSKVWLSFYFSLGGGKLTLLPMYADARSDLETPKQLVIPKMGVSGLKWNLILSEMAGFPILLAIGQYNCGFAYGQHMPNRSRQRSHSVSGTLGRSCLHHKGKGYYKWSLKPVPAVVKEVVQNLLSKYISYLLLCIKPFQHIVT